MCGWKRLARARGRFGGRKARKTPDKVKTAASLMKDKSNRIKDICKSLGVSRATLYRYVTPNGEIGVDSISAKKQIMTKKPWKTPVPDPYPDLLSHYLSKKQLIDPISTKPPLPAD